jgi:hypothetical protein
VYAEKQRQSCACKYCTLLSQLLRYVVGKFVEAALHVLLPLLRVPLRHVLAAQLAMERLHEVYVESLLDE